MFYLPCLFKSEGFQFSRPAKNTFLIAANVVIVPLLVLLIFRKKILLAQFENGTKRKWINQVVKNL